MAAVAVTCLFAARTYRKATFIVTGAFGAILLVAVANIFYFVATGSQTIDVLGETYDFTERTFIWQYAIGLWSGRPMLGYGLNGFWSQPVIYDGFQRLHGWVLDNYHDGYISLLVETGLVGFALFLALCVRISAKLHHLLLSTPNGQRLSLEMTVAFLLMFFTINLTETYLSRSTNFLALLFAFLIVKIIPAPAPQPDLARVAAARLAQA